MCLIGLNPRKSICVRSRVKARNEVIHNGLSTPGSHIDKHFASQIRVKLKKVQLCSAMMFHDAQLPKNYIQAQPVGGNCLARILLMCTKKLKPRRKYFCAFKASCRLLSTHPIVSSCVSLLGINVLICI